MEREGGRPKEVEVWKHVTVLEGRKKKVKCKHCGFVFAASANRIKSHINQIPGKGIRPCKPDASNKGTSENQNLLDSQGLRTMDRPRDYNRLNERMVDWYMPPKTMWEGIKALRQENIDTKAMHRERIKVGPFYVSNIVNEPDLLLIQYVFENSSVMCTPFRSSHLYLHQSQLITLRPRTHLDSGIIDVFADILTESERRKKSKPVNWYLPVMFSSAALNGDASSFLDLVDRQKLRENYMFDDLKYCEKIFVPVHVEKDSCGHYYLYIIHMKNQEIEIWDSLCDRFIDKAERDQTTQKLVLAMDRLFKNGKFKEFYWRMMRNIMLQPNGHDCGIFVINYMQQLDNYVREKPLFQFDSNEERLNLVLKLLKSDLNQEKEKLYAEVARWQYAQVESENESSYGIKRRKVDSDNKVKSNNIGLKTEENDDFRGELLKALEPFMIGESTKVGGKKDIVENAALAHDHAAYKLRGDFPCLCFPHFGEFGNYKPLHSSVDAKLQAICEGLPNSQKQRSAGEPCSAGHAKPTMASDESESKSDVEDCKVENIASSSFLSDKSWAVPSSPESDVSVLDFSDSIDDTIDFGLEHFPSLEIDWSAI